MDIAALLAEYANLPRLADGRIDYAQADKAPVLSCFITYQGKILLLKRSCKVRAYQGKWCTVAGYMDEVKPLQDKALQELKSELGIKPEYIAKLALGEPYEFQDMELRKTWNIHPMLVVLKQPIEVNIDWEHADFEWINPARLAEYDTVPMLAESLRRALAAG